MMQVIEQTRDENIAMYMKLTKREIAEMLVNANEAVSLLQKSAPPPSFVCHAPSCVACHGTGQVRRASGYRPCDACGGKGY